MRFLENCERTLFVQAINPKLLIFVEGTSGNNFPLEKQANLGGYWWGGEPYVTIGHCHVAFNIWVASPWIQPFACGAEAMTDQMRKESSD